MTKTRTSISTRVDRWAYNQADHRPERNPKVIALMVALGANVLPTALGLQALPGSLSNTPTYIAQGSSAFVVLGCFLCVLGLLWPWRDRGLAIELAGTLLLGVGLGFYAVALLDIPPGQRAYAFGLSLGLALGSFLRAIQIRLYVHGRQLRSDRENYKAES